MERMELSLGRLTKKPSTEETAARRVEPAPLYSLDPIPMPPERVEQVERMAKEAQAPTAADHFEEGLEELRRQRDDLDRKIRQVEMMIREWCGRRFW